MNIECNNTTIDQEVQFLIEQFCIECRAKFNCVFEQYEYERGTYLLAIHYGRRMKLLAELDIYYNGTNKVVKDVAERDPEFIHWAISIEGSRDNRSFNHYKTLK